MARPKPPPRSSEADPLSGTHKGHQCQEGVRTRRPGRAAGAVSGLPDRCRAVPEHGPGLRIRPERFLGVPGGAGPGLAGGAAGGHRRVRGLAAAARGRAGRGGGGAAVGRAAGGRVDGEPEAVGAGGVLLPSGPARRGCGRAAVGLAARRPARRVEAVLASRRQGQAGAAAGDRGEDAAPAAAGAGPRPGAGDPGCLRAPAGSLLAGADVGSGCRVGEALGLRHEDIAAVEREVAFVPRVNANNARCKSGQPRTVPVSAGLIRLWGDYLHREYGQLDSDFVRQPVRRTARPGAGLPGGL
jgi:hypothetical protein